MDQYFLGRNDFLTLFGAKMRLALPMEIDLSAKVPVIPELSGKPYDM